MLVAPGHHQPSRPVVTAPATLLALLVLLTTAACAGPSTDTPSTAAASSAKAVVTVPTTGGDPAAPEPVCPSGTVEVVGAVSDTGLTELSGLVTSPTHPDVLWAHNDSGSAVAVHGLSSNGRDLGIHPIEAGVDVADTEDIATIDGHIVLADTGDNALTGRQQHLLIVDEPDPHQPGPVAAAIVDLIYPDGPNDVEAMFIDPIDRMVVLIAKARTDPDPDAAGDTAAQATIYQGPLPELGEPGSTPPASLTLSAVGRLDLEGLTRLTTGTAALASALVPGAQQPTAADITADGSVIAVRTYASVWLFARTPGQSAAQALAGRPCPGPALFEAQGEAVALTAGGDSLGYLTASEGVAALSRTTLDGPIIASGPVGSHDPDGSG